MDSETAIRRLNDLLEQKWEKAKAYRFSGRMFLVVRVPSIIFDKSTFDLFEDDICLPSGVFEQVWLLFYDSTSQTWGELKRLR